jgi:DNA-directed RNA polymerase subunit RPC12/RpoP
MSREPWDDDYPEEPYGEDPEGPQECDLEGSGDDDVYDVVACPHCGHEVSELAQQCPHCGDWIVLDTVTSSRRRRLLMVIAVLLLIAVLLWVF